MPRNEEAYVLILEYIQGEPIVQWLSRLPNTDDLGEEFTEHLESYERVASKGLNGSQKLITFTSKVEFADDERPSLAQCRALQPTGPEYYDHDIYARSWIVKSSTEHRRPTVQRDIHRFRRLQVPSRV